MSGLRLEESIAQHSIGAFECVSMASWRTAITLRGLRILDENHMRVHAAHGRVCTFVVVDHRLPMPDSAVREESARLMRVRSSTQLCSATVIEGSGFWSATGRGVLTAIQLLSKHAYPLHTFSTVREAAIWTARQANKDDRFVDELALAVAELRAAPVGPMSELSSRPPRSPNF
ncbi:MAG: hypothetical protein U0271_19910 [Polyangiaceae bacterium]